MFNKILIANRGEIAVRIIRACRNLGIRSVAVYSKEDAKSLHVQLADQRICIGEGPARNSYLNMDHCCSRKYGSRCYPSRFWLSFRKQ